MAQVKSAIRELIEEAYLVVPEHEKLHTHPTFTCYNLLLQAPDDMLTVVSTCLRACYEANIPPSVGAAPGKSLFQKAYEIYCRKKEDSGSKLSGQDQEHANETKTSQEEKLKSIQSWQETNELLRQMILLLFSKAEEHLTKPK
mmetsp:Transcript_15832/g.17877  ORF Transcript_15832/g.17877 Transcript_15832/m.17877 type:complete len:143 (-) Transcript_15832:778-1206(-)